MPRRWIAPQADQSSGNPPGDYTYRLVFDLTGYDASTAVIRGRWSSDNGGTQILLNGAATGISGDGNFSAFSPEFTLGNGFVAGTNVLEFIVNMAANRTAVADPADGAFDDWFELFNAGSVAVSLDEFALTDNPGLPRRSVIPPGFSLAPGAFLLVWADGQPDQTRPGLSLHASFRLDRGGSMITLTDRAGRSVDTVRFGYQDTDLSEGRWGDGADGGYFRLTRPTAGTANANPRLPTMDLGLTAACRTDSDEMELNWLTQPGRRYVVERREQLGGGGDWLPLGDPFTAIDDQFNLRIGRPPEVSMQYYRVRLLP